MMSLLVTIIAFTIFSIVNMLCVLGTFKLLTDYASEFSPGIVYLFSLLFEAIVGLMIFQP